MTEIDDKSLLRCTAKKSVGVFVKVVKAAFLISLVTIATLIGGWVVTYVIIPTIFATINAVVNPTLLQVILATIIGFIFSIPWYYYAGVVVISAIPAYSFLWCVARELTEEDWKSHSANWFALILAIVTTVNMAILILTIFALILALAPTFAVIFVTTLARITLVLTIFALILALAIAYTVVSITTSALEPVDRITVWYYIFRFPGAVWHHWRK